MSGTSTTEDDPPPSIRPGRRVICHKPGPFNGKRGRVRDRIGQTAMVYLGGSTLVEDVTYFQPVQTED